MAKKAQNAQNSSPDSIKQYLRRVLDNINDMKHQDGVGKYVYSESARAFQYMHTECVSGKASGDMKNDRGAPDELQGQHTPPNFGANGRFNRCERT